MRKYAVSPLRQQEKVNAYFQSQSSYWKDVYASDGVEAKIIQERLATALAWIDSLALATGSHVLEIGCGAGYMAVALARRGFYVHAIDSSEAMVEQARSHASAAETVGQLTLDVGNVYSLPFTDGSFDLVVAIGVIAWLERPELAIQEIARVTKPNGHVILTAANRLGLNSLLDPWLNPVFLPLKRSAKEILERVGLRRGAPSKTLHSCRFFDKTLAQVELVKCRGMTLGFGPFSLFRRPVFAEPLGITLHHKLQRLADRNVSGFRSMGMSYLVLARKQAPLPLVPSKSAQEPDSECDKNFVTWRGKIH